MAYPALESFSFQMISDVISKLSTRLVDRLGYK